jgi:hypothetical protein
VLTGRVRAGRTGAARGRGPLPLDDGRGRRPPLVDAAGPQRAPTLLVGFVGRGPRRATSTTVMGRWPRVSPHRRRTGMSAARAMLVVYTTDQCPLDV